MAYARIEAEKTRLSRMRHTFNEERRASARHAVQLVCNRQGAAPLRCTVYAPDKLPPQRASELRARGQFELHGRGHHVAERGRLPHRFGQRERAACAAGFSCGLYDPETIFANTHRSCFTPEMDNTEREARCNGWQKAVRQALTH